MAPGDKTAAEKEIERLIESHGNDVLRIAYMYLKDRDLAQDAFQEVFIKIYKNFADFRKESSEKTWMIKITINVCKDILKSSWVKKVTLSDFSELNIISEEESVEQEFDKTELFQLVLTLPEKYKDVIVLFYYQGFSVKEIAAILDTTTGNVTSLLKRAREALKSKL